MKLTDLSIRKLRPQDKQVVYYYDFLLNFGVRVGKRSKTFVVKVDMSRSIESTGKYPYISLETVRTEAKALTLNPDTPKPSKSYSEAVPDFLEGCGSKNRSATAGHYRTYLTGYHPKKLLGGIKRADLINYLKQYKQFDSLSRGTLRWPKLIGC